MNLGFISAAIVFVASTSAHASPFPLSDDASKAFPRAQRYVGISAPDAPLTVSIDALRARASANDSSAFATMYAGLSKCRVLRKYGPPDTAAEYCSGVPEGDIADAGAWLSLAAEKGDEAAMYVFSIAGGQELRQSVVTARSKLAQTDYRVRAAGYLAELAEHCHVDAIDAIYRQKRSGGSVFAQDSYGAYLLQSELIELFPTLITPDERTESASRVSSADAVRAHAEAKSFVNSQCR